MAQFFFKTPDVPNLEFNKMASFDTSDHTKLRHLAFDESGHTGFQRELTQEQLEGIEAISQKVDKVTGKGLSSNDYTNEDKDKVNSCASVSYVDSAISQAITNTLNSEV